MPARLSLPCPTLSNLASVIAEQLPAKQLPELIAALMQKVETTPAIQKEMRAALRENAQ